ncbi:MAG: S8 family serine peptidase [Chitinophagaceae bacterium]|nr:S8 family serine peptidase [Chitinophagaceae bacterium]
MANDRVHLILNNPKGEKNHFDASRGYTPPEIEPKPASAYSSQKQRLGNSLTNFMRLRARRIENRTLEIPVYLEYIEIHFLAIFNDNGTYKTKTRFKSDYGLNPVYYSNFNQSVIFQIADSEKFNAFITLLRNFIKSDDTVHPLQQPYALSTIIYDFQFLSTAKIMEAYGEDVILSLVKKTPEIAKEFDTILSALLDHLDTFTEDGVEFDTDGVSILQVKNITRERLSAIADNFDILAKVASVRVPTIRANIFNVPQLTWNLTVTADRLSPSIGILDNGVKPIAPIAAIVEESDIDLTNTADPNPYRVENSHGTVVASLAAVGTDFFNPAVTNIVADGTIFPIKILNFDRGYFNIYDIRNAIIKAYNQGVRLFNLSVCGPVKNYNAAISEYAYVLDKLAYELDILIFIATGNLDTTDIDEMQQNPDPLHNYPNHFYNPHSTTNQHICEAMNICIPAESFNNVTVGAIADNLRPDTTTDLSLDKSLPAYYTRKHYLDYSRQINGTFFSDSQKNYNINKPDIVMPGGDLMNQQSAMQVFGLGENGDDFYSFLAGTSLATPLATNLAAKIMKEYPSLRLQSVKAIILNNATRPFSDTFLTRLINKIRAEEATARHSKRYSSLTDEQKRKINSVISSEILYKRLIGAGVPSQDNIVFSSEKSLTAIIEDSIRVDTYKVINLNIPRYLVRYTRATPILKIRATLCFKFYPIWGDALNYNPLHMSINVINSVVKNNPSRVAEIVSDRDNSFYNRFYAAGMKGDKKAAARSKALGVKRKLKPWSEDFYPRINKPFSNAQHFEIEINKNEIAKIGYQLSIVIRCTHKTDIERPILQMLKGTSHDFSVALTISEKDNNELAGYSLYDELLEINEFLYIEDLIGEDELDF